MRGKSGIIIIGILVLLLKSVLGAAPTIDSVILNSTTGANTTNENLTVFVIDATDADGNSVQNITDWRINRTSIAMLNTPFETNLSSTATGAIADYSTFRNNGTLGSGTAANVPKWKSSGKVGGAYTFDGVNDMIDFGNILSIERTNRASFEFWIYPLSNATSQFIIAKNDNANVGEGYYVAFLTSRTIYFFLANNYITNVLSTQGSTTLPLNAWSHVVVTYDGSSAVSGVKIYINGLADTVSGTSSLTATTITADTLRFGCREACGLFWLNATLDEVRIYINRTLTAQQAMQLYLDGNNSKHPETIVAEETEAGIWSVAVTPNDNTSDGTTVFSNNLTISVLAISARGCRPPSLFNEQSTVCNATVSGNAPYTVTANVTLPNTTQVLQTVTNISTNYTFNFSTTFSLRGLYNVTWFANNSLSENSSALDNFVVNGSSPTIAQLILNSTTGANNTNENLTVFVINATDADGNSVQNITDWRINRTSIAMLNTPFETNLSSTATGAIADYSTFRNNGTLGSGTAANVPKWNSGKVGGAYTFDGVNDLIDFGNVLSIERTNRASFEFWIYPLSNATAQFIIAKEDNANVGEGYSIRLLTTRKIQFYLGNNQNTNALSVQGSTALPLNAWSHVLVTYNGSSAVSGVNMYINGIADTVNGTSSLTASTITADTLRFGCREACGLFLLNATLDEVRIYINRTLMAQQAMQLYLDGNSSKHPETIVAEETEAGIWSVAVTPNDNTSDGTTVFSNNLTITNVTAVTGNSILGNETTVTTSGVSSLSVRRDSNSALNGSFTGNHVVEFFDGSTLLMNITWNATNQSFNLSKVSITRTSNSIVVNASGQAVQKDLILPGTFASICVKDTEITSISEISYSCTGVNETNFIIGTNCPGVTNGINCTAVSGGYKFTNLSHSGAQGSGSGANTPITQGTATITIESEATANLSDAVVVFSQGIVVAPAPFALIDTNGNNTNWNGAATQDAMEVINDGNTNLNITVKAAKNSSAFICEGENYLVSCGRNTSALPNFSFWADGNESNQSLGDPDSCSGFFKGGNRSSPREFNRADVEMVACENLSPTSGFDRFVLEFLIKIPDDAFGTKNNTITITARTTA